MHLGNVYAALMSWLSIKSRGGRWLLRIEDLDPERSRREYADKIMSDLEWLGLTWDGEPLWQSRRGEIYSRYFESLQSMGLIYPCFCTRADIMATQAPHQTDNRVVYGGTCRSLTPDKAKAKALVRKPAWRIKMPDEQSCYADGIYGMQTCNLATDCGDIILRRADGAYAYQLAVTVDDALSGVTQVVRGRDLLLSAHQQIKLCRLLGFTPPQFCHVPLLVNNSGQRLSKRDKSLALDVIRERYTAQQVIGLLAHATGLTRTPDPITPQELLECFDTRKIPTTDILIS